MTLMHPVILAYSIFIAAVYTGIVVITGRSYKKLYIVGLLAITVLPAAVLRFIDVPSASRYAFDLESALKTHYVEDRISNIEGTPFYGFNLERVKIPTNQSDQLSPLQFILSWAYLWLCGLGLLWSVLNLRKTAAPFIAATSLLLLLSAVPYTGWILGYFVTARMLWRTPWLLPIGLIGAKLLAELLGAVVPKLSWIKWTRITVERTTLSVIVLISISLTGYFSIYTYREIWKALAQLKSYRNSLENLSQLGDYLENNIKQPSIIEGGDYLDLYLAGLSSKSKVVSFGNESSPLYPVDKEELNLVAIQDKSISIEQRIDIMEKYHIQYVLVDKRWLAEYYTKNPHFRSKRIGDLWLLVFRKIDE
jgi:hypothetical protein